MVATVDDKGLVKAVGAGSAVVSVQADDGDRIISCEVRVTKRVLSTLVELDDISEEAEEFALYDLNKIQTEYWEKTELKQDSNGNLIPNEYHVYTGVGYTISELGKEEFKKYEEKEEIAKKKRLEIFNKLIDNKKSFVLLIRTKDCEEREYPVYQRSRESIKK